MKMKKLILILLISVNSIPVFSINLQNDLLWKTVPEITFNYPNKTGSKHQEQLIKAIWKDKLHHSDTAFSLLATINTNENIYFLSMLNSATSGCIAPPNGDGTNTKQDTYSICPIRVVEQNKINKTIKTRDIDNYCYLNLSDEPGELAKNHTEFAYDKNSKIVYFRTIMYGKHIPICNRAIRLK